MAACQIPRAFKAARRLHRLGAVVGALLPGLVAVQGLADIPPPAALIAGRHLIHMAPDGNDQWSGEVARPLPDGRDGPVASLAAARDRSRATHGRDAIVAQGGDYFLAAPVFFDASDTGLAIVAAPGETPVFHGGIPVTGWQADGHGVWSAPLPLPEGATVGALIVGGAPQVPARYPNLPANPTPRDGWLFAASPPTDGASNTQFRFHRGDIPPLDDMTGLLATIVGGLMPGTQWGSDTLPVVSIDRATRIVHTLGTGYFFTGEGSRYFLSGRPEFLDAPGEWWFDAASSRIRLIPAAGDALQAQAIAAVLPTFVQLNGAADMVIAGLTFQDGAPAGTGKFGTDTRGGGAIRVENSDRVQILANHFDRVGVAIHVAESNSVGIYDNDIAHVAGNAIYVGTTWGSFGRSDAARVTGNRIRHIGEVYFESAGIWLQASDRFRIAGNLIQDAAQFGIAAGSLWGSEDASHDGVIACNTVVRANQQTADGGAIKLMGAQSDLQNITIRGNVVRGTDALMNRADGTFWPPRLEDVTEWPGPISWAIYLDGRASGNAVIGNRLTRNVTAIGINGGWNNRISGNSVDDTAGSAIRIDDATGRDWRPDWAHANLITGNAFDITRPDGRAVDIHTPAHGLDMVHFAGNRYSGNLTGESFSVLPKVMATGRWGTLADFQGVGQEPDLAPSMRATGPEQSPALRPGPACPGAAP